MRIAKEAWPFVLPCLAFGAGAALAGFFWTGVLLLVLGFLVAGFFRNPTRRFDGPEDSILAPADGRVLSVERVEDPDLAEGEYWNIATFLSVFDVHVQRCPAAGRVVRAVYRKGLKLPAFRPEAGVKNESWTTVFELANGQRIAVRQLAGLIARRVVGYLREDQHCRRGDLLGIIKFGSRVDLLVPVAMKVAIRPGDRVRAGETVVARR